ncbi:hypothetical protein ACN9K5_04220 [Aliarcobacter butzleri]|uniref:hypothetical protein n=1 Tax=Aliarcobacter butzleri TaxID=28197 RepID=UPI003B2166F0
MSNKKYLYIDDENDAKVESLVESINRHNNVTIIKYDSMLFADFVIWIQENRENCDGILLDLILNDKKNNKEQISEYTAPVAAQYLRTLATDGKIKDLPIVLCSTDDRLDKLYTNDLTSHNLFDMRFKKDDTDQYELISKELNSLAIGYEKILELRDIDKILDVDITNLNEKIFARFLMGKTIPEHEKAQFILKELIFKTGPLIDEYILAARLGVDIQRSSDWEKLKTFFSSSLYNGVFSDGWQRWWMFKVNNIFKSFKGKNLSYLDASERIAILKEITKLENLVEPNLLMHCNSTRYWTVNINTKEALDPSEGFRVASQVEPKSWQEYNYLSPYDALERIGREDKGYIVHKIDEDRLEYLKEILEN